jgi:hypothetical protein
MLKVRFAAVEEDGTTGHSGRREVETSEEGDRRGRRSF